MCYMSVIVISTVCVYHIPYLLLLMYTFSFFLFSDKIEEAQKELNGAEVSKKGKCDVML